MLGAGTRKRLDFLSRSAAEAGLPMSRTKNPFLCKVSAEIRKVAKMTLTVLPFPRNGGRQRATPDEGKFHRPYMSNLSAL